MERSLDVLVRVKALPVVVVIPKPGLVLTTRSPPVGGVGLCVVSLAPTGPSQINIPEPVAVTVQVPAKSAVGLVSPSPPATTIVPTMGATDAVMPFHLVRRPPRNIVFCRCWYAVVLVIELLSCVLL
jgi:hypothetical protein